MSDSKETVKIVCSDGKEFVVERRVAFMSELVKQLNQVDPSNSNEICLPNITGAVFSLVLDFCNHHIDSPMRDIEKPLKGSGMNDNVEPWDATFIDLDDAMLYQLIVAANYLMIQSLLDLSCAKVASEIKGKTTQEIRERFHIKNDFTPEEEEKIRQDNKWAEDL